MHAVPARADGVQPRLQLAEQIVEPQVREDSPGSLVVRRWFLKHTAIIVADDTNTSLGTLVLKAEDP
ncbi:hypothetical protein GCM10010182_76680 [Actinomadura cremea]|nr:hypothetical protein GCM10010182_76680 [Actinomadura cremea]